MARPRIEIDWEEFDKLCNLQCTLDEIAGWFKCSPDTLQRAVKREKKTNYATYYLKESVQGKISLRRKQFQVAMAGDRVMLIFLGKNWLGQSDRTIIEGNEERPLRFRAVWGNERNVEADE